MPKHSLSMTAKRAGATAAVAIGLVAGGVGVAAAASSSSTTPTSPAKGARPLHFGRHGMFRLGSVGTVSASSSSSVTLTKLDGSSTTFSIDSSTVITKGRDASATVADLTTGVHIAVIPTASGSTTAKRILIQVPELGGQVTAVTSTTITVTDREGFWRTINVSGSTTYTKSGVSATASDVVVGSIIRASGAIDADHTSLDASSVEIGLPGGAPGGFGVGHGPGDMGAGPVGPPGGAPLA